MGTITQWRVLYIPVAMVNLAAPMHPRVLSPRMSPNDREIGGDVEPIKHDENLEVLTPDNVKAKHDNANKDDYEANSLVSWKDAADMNDAAGTSSLGSWNDEANGWSGPISEGSMSKKVGSPVVPAASPRVRMSWADMAEEDELEEEEETEISRESIDQREYIHICNLPVKQDENLEVLTLDNVEAKHDNAKKDDYDANSLVSWKDAADMNDTADTSSLGSWNDWASGLLGPISEGSTSEKVGVPVFPTASPRVQMSWAYMAQKSIDQREYSRWW